MVADSSLFSGHRAMLGASLAATVAALAYLWFGWCVFPISDWNELRLAPAFALRHGIAVYSPLGGGPLSTWIYGPLGVVINLPATFASTPMAALQTAAAINLLTLVVPLVLIVWTAESLKSQPWPARMLATALCVLLLPVGAVTYQVADHTAIACGIISCWCLSRKMAPSNQAAAAAWCVLGACAKQTAVFLVLAHVIFLARYGGLRPVVRYLAWSAVFGAIAAAICIGYFGQAPLWFNLVEVPGRIPWGDPLQKLAFRWPHLLIYAVAPLAILLLWRRSKFWPDRATEFGRMARCSALVFLILFPVGMLSLFKIGGASNVLHSSYYLVPILVVAFIPHASPGESVRPRSLVALVAFIILAHIPEYIKLPARPLTRNIEQATLLARVAPHSMWFPNNPVVTFYSDGKLYHVEDGLSTRHLAGFAVRKADFQKYLPANLITVAYPANYGSFALQLLPEFVLSGTAGYWALYQRAPPAQP